MGYALNNVTVMIVAICESWRGPRVGGLDLIMDPRGYVRQEIVAGREDAALLLPVLLVSASVPKGREPT
jgi:hypothetical protein